MSIRGFALGMEHMKPRTVMMGGSCMSITPLIPTPGYGCVVPMMEDAPEPSTLAAMLRRVVGAQYFLSVSSHSQSLS